ncbi:hypothetical protein F5B22DRAFT_643436 [Xylaria bambusicola]|uniref:uncharacterized protein n=1 Tax=Xylaria bambusicola TaxID=326684 RepID=UPI002008689B|nr:uncharacterized protein F5B22DRAFT_643436 [Xylaria bambusicola]KAI0521850.1 hypothetical protein F5B22DRAFT_643436 [Xylaria bambusicola]
MSKVGGLEITEEIQISSRVDLNHTLNNLIEPMQTPCFRAAEKAMPACPDWTSVVLYPKILELFSHMHYPALYWTAYYLDPEAGLVNGARREAAELARPVLEAQQSAYAADGARAENHDDFIQWIMDNYRANGKTITRDEIV